MHFFKSSALPASPVAVTARFPVLSLPLALTLALSLPAALAQAPSPVPNAQPAPASQAAPTASTATPTTVLARGPGGVAVTVADVMSELLRAPDASRQAALARPETLQQIANNLLVRRVLAAEATRDGLGKDPIVAASVAIAQDRALSDARLARLDAQNTPSDAALEAYARNLYQANATKFDKPAQTRARHILLANSGPESLQKAKDLLAQLRAGASFEELAKTHSTDAGSGARGGDLGFFSAGQMVRPFEDAVNALAKPGDLSEPIESQFGYHIIRLEERREKGRQPYDEVRAQLLAEARTAILNESRLQKVQLMNKDIVYEREIIEGLARSTPR